MTVIDWPSNADRPYQQFCNCFPDTELSYSDSLGDGQHLSYEVKKVAEGRNPCPKGTKVILTYETAHYFANIPVNPKKKRKRTVKSKGSAADIAKRLKEKRRDD